MTVASNKADYKRRRRQLRLRPQKITDSLQLTLPLLQAERAWAHAMHLKADIAATAAGLSGAQDSGAGEDEEEEDDFGEPRQRFHLLRRLRKASQYAEELNRLCARVGSPKTRMEAQAYASWMRANVHLERDQHDEAFKQFTIAARLYRQLVQYLDQHPSEDAADSVDGQTAQVIARLGDSNTLRNQALYEERIAQIQPNLRYCQYVMQRQLGGDAPEFIRSLESDAEKVVQNLLRRTAVSELPSSGTTDAATPPVLRDVQDLVAAEEGEDELLNAKLRAVREQTRKQRAKQFNTVEWLGQSLQVQNHKLRLALVDAEELNAQVCFDPFSRTAPGQSWSLHSFLLVILFIHSPM